MSWTLPTPLLLFAGVVALLPLARLLRRPVSGPRLMVEAFGNRARGHRRGLAGVDRAVAARATLVSTRDRPVLAPDDPAGAPGAVAHAGDDGEVLARRIDAGVSREGSLHVRRCDTAA